MKKQWLVIALFPSAVWAQGANNSEKAGYSYFTFGVENVKYQEHFPGLTSDVMISSPMLNTGGLYRVTDKFDFSIDTMATFSPMGNQEKWKDGNGLVTQTNQFEYLKASTHVMLQYKWQENWRLLAGGSLTYQTYTRYGLKKFTSGESNIFKEGNTWEEKSTNLFADVGIAYDSGTLWGTDKWRAMGRLTAGIPLYSATENTAFPDASFNAFGYRTNFESTLSYELTKGLHLGWYVAIGYEKRFEADSVRVTYIDANGQPQTGLAWLPEADTWNVNTGLQALWYF
ncbi:hypothetical protein VA249_26640 [Vibrio alfacsensis]|uniref:hypothetical protein n=1 Tax=Vibrio alfacsensis TaxID=1074311 RepID=UPI001BEE15A0|nr:hypothetical protein [Vibrio alfacsensis]BBM66018.1 hypothetical protein VA249_26640 [Vibrio alfacsensis]